MKNVRLPRFMWIQRVPEKIHYYIVSKGGDAVRVCVRGPVHYSPSCLPSRPPADKDLLLRSQEESQRLQRRAGRHQEKRDKIERHNRRLGELLERRSRELQSRLSQLAALRREHILELTTHIFPTQEEKQGSR